MCCKMSYSCPELELVNMYVYKVFGNFMNSVKEIWSEGKQGLSSQKACYKIYKHKEKLVTMKKHTKFHQNPQILCHIIEQQEKCYRQIENLKTIYHPITIH